MDAYMEPDKVDQMAERIDAIVGILRVISGVLEAQINILNTTAFIGAVGGAAVARYASVLKAGIDQRVQCLTECSEMARQEAAQWRQAGQAG